MQLDETREKYINEIYTCKSQINIYFILNSCIVQKTRLKLLFL